ncbi:hypothetical protein PSTT_02038 [Puccinia striiformis]|uniref:CCHC-type domain-containing protein n=1 Tax=Puccinia striiformis TaxID=27350 RepID=A0A2S4W193_9BASI|nr:hypothetical protein PSTT_02038 [Puccinia striiformis]
MSNPSTSLTSSHPPSVFAASISEDQAFEADVFLTEIGEEDWVDALDFYALTASKCWQCGDGNHYARDCPDKSSGSVGGKQVGKPLGTIVGTIYGHLPSGLQVNSTRFPRMTFRKTLTPPSKHQEHAQRLADYYRPKYAQAGHQSTQQSHSATPQASTKGGVSAHLMEAWSLPDDLDGLGFNNMALGEDLVSSIAVFDTGASHGFTGSKFLLHDFRPLSKPMGVSVATNGAGSFITGMGSLKFQAPDGRIIVLRQVLYCEQAKTTLISMAALRKANAFVAYDNNTDTFWITRSNGEHLFDCAFEPSKNRWCMPYPMIRLDVVGSDLKNCSLLVSQVQTDKTDSTTNLFSTPYKNFSSTQSPVSSLSVSSHVQSQSGCPAKSSPQSISPLPTGNEISIFASKAKSSPPPYRVPRAFGKSHGLPVEANDAEKRQSQVIVLPSGFWPCESASHQKNCQVSAR